MVSLRTSAFEICPFYGLQDRQSAVRSLRYIRFYILEGVFDFTEVQPERITIDKTSKKVLIKEQELLTAIYSKFTEHRYIRLDL